jgi:iron complex outermembrane recepter protein
MPPMLSRVQKCFWQDCRAGSGGKRAVLIPVFLFGVWLCRPDVAVAGKADAIPLLRDATFEELANLTVTTVSKREEHYFQAAAAVHVITAEDIRRSGALLLPEVLRLSPGVEVGAINSRSYAVTIRGFNGTAANKVLPLIDGRSLYSQRFAGTIWDIRDLPLEDVEQIEVIGGPGGTTWGANAVNGVINIITKSARDTQGDLLIAGAGTFEQGYLYGRHGFSVGRDGWARVYLKAFQRDDSEQVNSPDNNDAWKQVRAGFRYDRPDRSDSQLMVTGDVFYSDADQVLSGLPDVAHSSGGHLLAKQQHALSDGTQVTLQSYLDVMRRDSGGSRSSADVVDLDLVATPPDDKAPAWSWGANYRLSRLEDSVGPSTGFVSDFKPAVRCFSQGGVFLENTWRPDAGYRLTAGAKAEYNDFTQWEFMPSLRAAWTPNDATTFWTSWSRAARIPSRYENDQSLTFASPGFSSLTLPSPDLEAEVLNAFELGARWRRTSALSVDANLYYHEYTRLETTRYLPSSDPTLSISNLDNLGRGQAWGAELQMVWRPVTWWQMQVGYSYLDMDLRVAATSGDTTLEQIPNLSPRHQVSLRSSWNFGRTWELDAWFRAVSKLPQSLTPIPAYETLDLRLSKQLGRGWEVALVGQNLLSASHQEFRFFTTRAAVARGFYLRIAKY